jgi:gamma-glutamyl-gamma-aminobutyrate hydrolase PuuD
MNIITQAELLALIIEIIDENNQIFPTSFDWYDLLIKNNYEPIFQHINFKIIFDTLKANQKISPLTRYNLFAGIFRDITFIHCVDILNFRAAMLTRCIFRDSTMRDISHSVLENVVFERVEFSDTTWECLTLENVTIKKSVFQDVLVFDLEGRGFVIENCHIQGDSFWYDVPLLNTKDYNKNTIAPEVWFQETSWDEYHLKYFEINPEKSLILMTYEPADGILMTDKLLRFLQRYRDKIQLVRITSRFGMKHPIFSSIDAQSQIAGIILSGGPDIEIIPDVRERFEKFLIELSCAKKIPLLGICRGHQMVGQYFGASIYNIYAHTKNTIFVKPQAYTSLYEHLDKKYTKWSKETKRESALSDSLKKNPETGIIHYQSLCAHHQRILFTSPRDKKNIKIVAKAADKTIEALEINAHIVSFQHHHEALIHRETDSGRLAKSLLKRFLSMVKLYQSSSQDHEISPAP